MFIGVHSGMIWDDCLHWHDADILLDKLLLSRCPIHILCKMSMRWDNIKSKNLEGMTDLVHKCINEESVWSLEQWSKNRFYNYGRKYFFKCRFINVFGKLTGFVAGVRSQESCWAKPRTVTDALLTWANHWTGWAKWLALISTLCSYLPKFLNSMNYLTHCKIVRRGFLNFKI